MLPFVNKLPLAMGPITRKLKSNTGGNATSLVICNKLLESENNVKTRASNTPEERE